MLSSCFLFVQVLCSYFAWTSSTSGVEQMFAKIKRSPVELSCSKADSDRRAAIGMGYTIGSQSADDALVHEARVIYSRLLSSGKARDRPRPRFDVGRKGVQTSRTAGSEAQWQRDRRRAVEEQAAKLETPQRRTRTDLPDSLEKECARQGRLQAKRKVEAVLDGLVMGSDLTPELKRKAQQKQASDRAADMSRAVKRQLAFDTAQMTTSKKSVQWALQHLPCRAWISDKNVTAAERDRWARRLATSGVTDITTEAG